MNDNYDEMEEMKISVKPQYYEEKTQLEMIPEKPQKPLHFQDHPILSVMEKKCANKLKNMTFVEKSTLKGGKRIYKGYVDKKGHKSGLGIEILTGMGSRYEGEYLNNEAHGFGIYYKGNENFYEGEWQNGKMHGEGIRHKGKKNELRGRFENNKKVAVSSKFLQESPRKFIR